jgi:hypothetical protein
MTPLCRLAIAAALIVVVAIGIFHEKRAPQTTKPVARASSVAPSVDQRAVPIAYCRRIHSVPMPADFQYSDVYPPDARERILAYHPEYGPGYARTVCLFDRWPKHETEPWPEIDKGELVVTEGLCEPWLREVRIRLRRDSPAPDMPACGDSASDM